MSGDLTTAASMVCQCSVYLAPYFSESGIITLIQSYAANLPPSRDIIIYFLQLASQCRKMFGFSLRYDLCYLKLETLTMTRLMTTSVVDPYNLADALSSKSLRDCIYKIMEYRSDIKTLQIKFDSYLDTISDDLREFSTPRCRHDTRP